MKATNKTHAAKGRLLEPGTSLPKPEVKTSETNNPIATNDGTDKIKPAAQNPQLLCFHCWVEKNMRMVVKVLQAPKVLLRRNAPKARVEKGINIARAIVQDFVDLVGLEHKKH